MMHNICATEIDDAKQEIATFGDKPDQFSFAVMENDPKPSRNDIFALTYSVTVSRGNARPKTYKGGHGMNWVVYFVDDLKAGAFITTVS